MPETREMLTRAVQVRAATIDEENRSVEAVIATELPVEMWHGTEILLASGMRLPGGAKQVPLLNAHDRSDVEDVLGSVREFKTGEGQNVARLYFAKAAQAAFEKVKEGHLTDVSVGYEVDAMTFVDDGTEAEIEGKKYAGPCMVATAWTLKEVSLVPIGADRDAKVRSKRRKGSAMSCDVRAALVARGLIKDDASEKELEAALLKLVREDVPADEEKAGETEEEKSEGEEEEKPYDEEEMASEKSAGNLSARALEVAAEKALARIEQKRAAHRQKVDVMCELAGVPAKEAERFYGEPNEDKIRKELLKLKRELEPRVGGGGPITGGEAQIDKHRSAVGTALLMRALSNAGASEKTFARLLPESKRAKDWESFEHASLFDLARECLHMDGVRTQGMSRENVAIAALGFASQAGIRAGAYHVSASFPKLLQDAVNKSMQTGYSEVTPTWRGPMRQGASVADFKTIHRCRAGAVPNIPAWMDNTDPHQVSLADSEETYAVEAYSAEISFSWRLLINDDMDAVSRIPSQMGAAFARTVNAAAWQQITANPTMGDGVALFSAATGARKRANLITGSATPTVATVGSMTELMRLMRGENTPEGNESDDILNLQPAYIVGPPALEVAIKQLVMSAFDPVSNKFQVYNPTSTLTPIIEPILQTASSTAWYLFANPSQIDTVEVTFLQGHESPVMRNWVDDRSLAQSFAGVQAFAAKAMNHRGIIRHAGA